jgi:hypothetical protein
VSTNPTSFRLPSAYTIPTHIEHEGKKIALPTQLRDNVRMLFNGLLDAHQAIISLKDQLGTAGGTVVNNNTSNTTVVNQAGGSSFTTAGQGYFWGPGIFLPLSMLNRVGGSSWMTTPNGVNVVQFTMPVTFQVSIVSMFVTANALGKFAGFGIYSADGATLIVDSHAMSLNATGLVTSPITSVLLPPGTYNYAQTSDSTTASMYVNSNSVSVNDGKFMNTNAGAPRYATAANASIAGQLPATLGALTAVTALTLFDTALVMFEP